MLIHKARRGYNIHQLVSIETTYNHLPVWIEEFYDAELSKPDIQLELVDTIDAEICFTDLGAYGYNEAGLIALSKDTKAKKLLIPIDQLGKPFSIQLEQGASAIPLFEELLHLVALTKEALPLHASAFQYQGKTVLVSAFPHGGKTSLLLSFMAEGANFISDDWLYLKDAVAYGLPIPLTIRSWQIEQLSGLKTKRKLKQNLLQIMAKLSRGFPKLSNFLDKRAALTISPAKIFPQGFGVAKADIFCVSLVHDSDEIRIEKASPEQMLALLLEMQMHEWETFLRLYRVFRAEFPQKRNAILDNFEMHLKNALEKSIQGLQLYCIYHPHPVSLKTLFQAFEASIVMKDG